MNQKKNEGKTNGTGVIKRLNNSNQLLIVRGGILPTYHERCLQHRVGAGNIGGSRLRHVRTSIAKDRRVNTVVEAIDTNAGLSADPWCPVRQGYA